MRDRVRRSGGAASAGNERAAVERVIDGMPEPLRVVFVLKEMEGYSPAEIGTLLGIRPGAAEVRLHRARRFLRHRLRGHL